LRDRAVAAAFRNQFLDTRFAGTRRAKRGERRAAGEQEQ
jgi:hypothetical protein